MDRPKALALSVSLTGVIAAATAALASASVSVSCNTPRCMITAPSRSSLNGSRVGLHSTVNGISGASG
mgnify:CR=1 FL=1